MKITAILCATLFVSGAFFTSCSKKSSDVPTGPTSADSAQVKFQVTATNRDNGLIHFTAVQGAGKQVAFKGNGTSRVEMYKYNFQPSDFMSTAFDLTTVSVQPGTYTNAEFNYQLIPSRDPALKLVGTWNNGGVAVPVEVNIDQFLEISTMIPTISLEAGHTYTALLKLDLAQVQNGIYAGDLSNATRTNGKIVIAYYSNSNLLQVFINNINNVIHHEVTVQ